MNRGRIMKWLKVAVIIYCSIGIALYYLQEFFLFHPVELERSYQYNFQMPFKEVSLPFNSSDTTSLVQFFPADSNRKGIVIYFHGNRENISRYAKFVHHFTAHGYEVWMPDYPGFGKSTGARTEQNIYRQAEQVYKLAASRFSADSIVVYGKSFGTGIATYTASIFPCRQLVLETPYYSIPDLFGAYAPIYPTSRMSVYKIPLFTYLQDVKVPVTIFHGTSDGVIPYRCASKLKKLMKAGDRFITIEKGTHHNLDTFPVYREELDAALGK